MSKEFKKIIGPAHTRYVIENATGGATGTAAVSSNTVALPGVRRRTPEADNKVPQKPRQGPLRPQTGAGKHKDKKRDDKQGKAKHKKPYYEDHEVSMASNELKSIYADAKELLALVQKYGEQGDIEAWQQSKITKAADYLNSVLQSIGGEHSTELTELEKPSGTLYIILVKDRSESVRVVGDFGTFPAEVQARASKVGIKDKEGRKERPLKVNFLMTSASQALAELDKALADVDFIGGEKAEFVFKNSAFDTDIEAEVNELQDLISSGADERFKNYEEPEVGSEPETKPKGVDHFVVGPDGKRRRVPMPGKPSSQMGGHAVEQPKTFTYQLKKTELGPKLRSMGFKVDGSQIVLSKQQRDQLLAKMGDQQFGQIFGQGGKFTEGQESGDEDYMNQTVSDLHREIYGFGPGKQFVYEWQKMSFDEKVKVYNKLKHLAGKLEEARYGRNHNPDSYSGSIPATDKIPQDSTAGQDAQQRMERKLKLQTIDRLLDRHPDWERSDLELASLPELIQMLSEGIPYSYGFVPGRKKPNATTRHLRDYPVSDKDVAKPVKKPEKKKPEQGVAEGHADQQRKIFKKNGKPVGEVGIDRESSPGVGQWYMKCYAYDIDNSGYDSYEEAVAELKYCLKQGVAEGSDKLQGTPVVSLKDLDSKDTKKNRYGQTVPKKLKKDDSRVKFHKDEKQAVAEGSGKNVVKSVKVGNFRHDLVDTGMGWQVRIYNGDELYDTGMSKNSEQKGLAALEDAVAYTEKQTRTKRQGVAEGSLETDNMVSHIGQVIQSIYPRGGDKNTYMKLVAQEMPRIVKANPKLFRRAFGMAYDRFFHIDQDDDFDYTDYSMRKGERGMAEVRGNIDADQAGFYVVDDDGNAVSGPFASKQEAYERAAEMGRMYDVKYKGDIIPLDSLISKIIKTLPPDVTSDDLQDPMDLEQQLEILRSPLLRVFSKLSPHDQAEVTDEVANYFYDKRFGDLDEGSKRCPQCGSTNCTCPPGKCNCKPVKGWLAKKEVDEEKQRLDPSCWKGYKKQGTKMKGGVRVNNCVPKEDAYSESLMTQLNSIISEKAPPGDKYERMVKHIKKGYAKDGKISDKERSIAYATAWKAKNKAKK